MPNWMNPEEAMRYLGVNLERLEQVVLEYGIDVDLDGEGAIELVDADDMKEPLFQEHRNRVGYRPDDEKEQEKAKDKAEKAEVKAKQVRKAKRVKLARRVSMNHNA
jgi:hypothetical protein